MKKFVNIVIFSVLIFGLFSCSRKELMRDYVSKDYYNYEYTVKNPLLYYLGIPDLNEVKGKILKKTNNAFTLASDGKVYYENEYVFYSKVDYFYYFFDSEGRINKMIGFIVFDNDYLGIKQETVFSYESDKIIMKKYVYPEKDEQYGKTQVVTQEYSFYPDKDGYLVFYNNQQKKIELKFKNRVIISYDKYYIIESRYENDALIERYYANTLNQKLIKIEEYQKGVIHKITDIYDSKKSVTQLKDNIRTINYYEDSTLTQTEADYYEQEFYPSGLIKSIRIFPGKKDDAIPGYYVFQDYEIITEPDKWLQEYDKQIQGTKINEKIIEKNTFDVS